MPKFKLNILSIKTILKLIIISCILGVVGIIGVYLETYKVTYGRIKIKDIKDANLLKVVQTDIDYLIDIPVGDNGHYTAIVPFSITAGFDLDKIKIDEDNKTVKIYLPLPEILSVDTSDESKILRISNTENYNYLIKGFKQYAEKFVTNYAKYNIKILQKANKNVKDMLRNMLEKSLAEGGKELEIITTAVNEDKRIPAVYRRSDYHPVGIKIYDKSIAENVFKDSFPEIFFGYNINGIKNNRFWLYRIFKLDISVSSGEEFLKFYDNNYGILFNPDCPYRKILITYNNDTSLSLFFTFKDWIYRAIISSPNTTDFEQALPEFLDIINNIQFLSDYSPLYKGKDILGFLTEKNWENKKIEEQRDYFWRFYVFSLSPYFAGENIMGYKYYWNPRWRHTYLIESKDEPYVVTDEDGLELLKDDSSNFWDNITNAINNSIKEEDRDKVIAVIYNHNKIHRNRFLIIFNDEAIFYIPERFIQSAVIKDISYKDMILDSIKGTFDNGCLFRDVSEKAFESPSLCKFLKDFLDYGFPAVYRK